MHLQFLSFSGKLVPCCIGATCRPDDCPEEVVTGQEIQTYEHFCCEYIFATLPTGSVVLGFLPRNFFEKLSHN